MRFRKFARHLVIVFIVAISIICGWQVAAAHEGPAGLVGQWNFDDGTGKDLSGNGANADFGGSKIVSLGSGHACLEITKGAPPMSIATNSSSPLAVSRGTFCMWVKPKGTGTMTNILQYDNKAVWMMVYRDHFQTRFKGEGEFKYGSSLLDDNWPKYLLRENAFYPEEKAVVGDGVWHQVAVAYDDRAKKIIGWRDGELISARDLSMTAMEPLVREGLTSIVTGATYNGLIDNIRIYNKVLTTADIKGIYDSERSAYADQPKPIPGNGKTEVYQYQNEDRTLYQAWLQNRPVTPTAASKELLSRIVVEGTNSTIRTAGKELAGALKAMVGGATVVAKPAAGAKVVLGTPETSAWIRGQKDALGLERVKLDGYVIRTLKGQDGTTLVVAAPEPAGVIFGVFDLIRRIQLGEDPAKLDLLENPKVAVRMVNHWSIFRGTPGDSKITGRNGSIFSWEDLRTGNTKLIRDWVRLMASAGWNAISPAEINWDFRDNYLDHLDEVKTLAGIFRDYGIKLYWTPNYLLALRQETADKLYAAVPDFGGYLLKLGSEAQDGDPRPPMVNKIADTLKSHGGYAIVRAFVYGKYRYSKDDIRDLNPYDIFAPNDGAYRSNVIILSKGSPLDWDFSAPIPALDGAMQKTLYGSELVIAKDWPLSWVGKWKWWLEQDNYHNGPGSLNKLNTSCIVGVSMINPSPGWTSEPLNMVNYYGLGRLGWNPDLSLDAIYTEWARLTFGDDPDVTRNVKTILQLSENVTTKLYLYRGYRGVWLDPKTPNLVVKKTPHTMTHDGLGVASPELRKRLLDQYAPGLRAIYGNPVQGEQFLPYFNYVKFDYRMSNGKTVLEEIYSNMDEAVKMAAQMPELWKKLDGKIDAHRYQYTLDNLNQFIDTSAYHRGKMMTGFETATGRKYADVMAGMKASNAASVPAAEAAAPTAAKPKPAKKAAAKAAKTAKKKAATPGAASATASTSGTQTADEKLAAKMARRAARGAEKAKEEAKANSANAISGGANSAAGSKGPFNVRAFDAKADGTTNDAPAINKAIDACSAAGGGTVLIPAGVYATGSIHLKSNITLALDQNALLVALAEGMDPLEANPNDQGLMDTAYYHCHAAVIWGENLENVKIVGPGTIDGTALTKSSKVPAGIGDRAISLKLCKNIEIRNLGIEQGGHYAIFLTGCEKALLDNVTINTSRDGVNLIQSRDVMVSNSHINAVRYADGRPAGGDDAIKLGSDLSLGEVRVSENITVRNCVLASGCNTLQFGTETAGSFKNVKFEDIRILCAGKAGIGVTSNDGGVIDTVTCKNITMEQTFLPFFIKLSDVARVPKGSYQRGAIRNLTFENITATNGFSSIRDAEMPSVIWGKPGCPIENVVFKNVRITALGGHPVTEAALNPNDNDEKFPKAVSPLPAYAMYLRHVKQLRFVDCDFGFEKSDGRPALVVDDGSQVGLESSKLQRGEKSTKLVDNRNGSDVIIDAQQVTSR